jgi:hypothetical protein
MGKTPKEKAQLRCDSPGELMQAFEVVRQLLTLLEQYAEEVGRGVEEGFLSRIS